ncbi:hypothetical protein HBI24_031420 [Parastagonospora nodorum]|nr:hypothetical protein HBH51_150150 [Parastagonospora nodorum]KAH4418117.1 hypothetical protein HBH92_055260 [Parastagonospora nodorum]KAH4450039.1 hypothetical protein HBH93_033810 [Parastagonospora nodorum]KAH4464057.1 hypothetical protein HBH91_051320 [Parastagonospora nodorum]KAH4506906.1 hypothetical protein HBH89_081340 [Parastagonospora nodorum]
MARGGVVMHVEHGMKTNGVSSWMMVYWWTVSQSRVKALPLLAPDSCHCQLSDHDTSNPPETHR